MDGFSTSNSVSSELEGTFVSTLGTESIDTQGVVKPRKGGDKERRLYRRRLPDSGLKISDTTGLFTLRVNFIPWDTKFEEILQVCKKYGEVANSYRPMNLAKRRPSPFAFIRFKDPEEALKCMHHLDGMQFGDNLLSVTDGNEQDSFFTQDTGYITNEKFDTVERIEDNFDGSLPPNHWEMKRREQMKNADEVYSVRIEDLAPEITKAEVESVFQQFGDIATVYMPVNLNHLCPKPMGLAFVRYLRLEDAHDAVKSMHNTRIGAGRRIQVSMAKQQSYFGQDESVPYGAK